MFNSQQKRDALLFFFCAILIMADGLIFSAIWFSFYAPQLYIHNFFAKGHIGVIGLFMAMYYIFARLYGGFDVNFSSVGELVYSHTIAVVISSGFLYLIIALLVRAMPSVMPMLLLLAGLALTSALWAFAAKKITVSLLAPRRTVLIYDNREARENGEGILLDLPNSFRLVASVCTSVGEKALYAAIRDHRARAVMLCGIPSSLRNDLVKYCIDHDIEAYVRPNIGDFLIKGARSLRLSNLPVLLCHRASPAIWYLFAKRVIDIVASLAALLVFSPFMLLTAIAIKAYDGGPVLYKQLRLTKDRREFYVYKFRSMRVDAEKDGVARLASQHDDRITPVGRIIRSTRLDETPQLFCILAGTMTIVGPRPERPEIAAQYEKEMPEFALRLQVKAGLTGLAQVYGKYNTSPYNKLQMDLEYIGSMGLVMDLKIMFATVKALFQPESTEGVSAGQTTAAHAPDNSGQEKENS